MDVRAGVIDNINEYGMKIIIDDQLPADLSDMSTTLTKVKALKPDILIISGHSKGAATAARQIDEMKVNVPMIALTHCEAAKVQEKFPNAATGFLCPTQWVETLSKSDAMFGSAMDWNEGFKKTTLHTLLCLTSQLRHLPPYMYGKRHSKRQTALIKTQSGMRFLQSKWKHSMVISNSRKLATT